MSEPETFVEQLNAAGDGEQFAATLGNFFDQLAAARDKEWGL